MEPRPPRSPSGLVSRILKFLLELGTGFAFLGLLFYHVKLRCFVIIDLKAGPFQPEYAGKLNFYLAAIDDILRHPHGHRRIQTPR